MRVSRSILVCSLALTLVRVSPPAASDPAEGSIGPDSPNLSWSGATFTAAAAVDNQGAGCFDATGRPVPTPPTSGTDACDVVTMHVTVEPAFWNAHTGYALVYFGGYIGDIALHVYRRNADGTRGPPVASSDTPFPGRAVSIPEPSGDYYVVAVARAVARSSYTGVARFWSQDIPPGADIRSQLHDVSEPIPGVSVVTSPLLHERIPAPDGLLLDAWIVVPDAGVPVPAVLEVTPYYGGGPPVDGIRHSLGRVADELVPRGYAVGVVSVRGTGSSGGCFTIGGPSEAKDTAAVVEHVARQPWSNGRVGLIGVSYPGTTPQDVWVEAPPSLKTIVPIAGISDLYKYNFVNGVPIVPQGYAFNTYYWPTTSLVPGASQARDPLSLPGAIAGEACLDQVEVQEGQATSAIDGNKDAYWQKRDFLAELRAAPGRQRASVFYIHGLEDWNVKPHNMEGWLDAVQDTGVPFKAWLGQWGHAYPARRDWWTAMTAWFDEFLKQRSTGILDVPAVQVQDDSGTWHNEAAWPPRDVEMLTLYPHADGTLQPTPGTGTASYRDDDGSALVFSHILPQPLRLAGMPRFEANVTADGHRASLLLTLEAGGSPINFAALSLNHASDLSNGEPSVAGRTQDVGLNFFPQDDVTSGIGPFKLIASGSLSRAPFDLRPVSTGSRITIDLSTARLILPIARAP